jgi:hypothetical protein
MSVPESAAQVLARLGYYYPTIDPNETVVSRCLDWSQYGMPFNPYDWNAWMDPQNFASTPDPAPATAPAPSPAPASAPAPGDSPKAAEPPAIAPAAPLPPPIPPLTTEKFQQARSVNTTEFALQQLQELGTDALTIPTKNLKAPIPRALFMLLNTYNDPKKSLGVGPLNDGITTGANHRLLGYTVYFLHNPTTRQFLEYFRAFLSCTTEYLTVYYSGHGAQVKDTSGDEADGLDEVMVFDQGYIRDDDLASVLRSTCRGKCKVVLIADCCRSGTLWDVPEEIAVAEKTFPANILSLSASADSQTSKQTAGLGGEGMGMQGLFTFHFFRHIRANRSLTPSQILPLVNRELTSYKQGCQIYPTRQALMDQPIFPP